MLSNEATSRNLVSIWAVGTFFRIAALASSALIISLAVNSIEYFGDRYSANLNPNPLFPPVIRTFLN